jgi:hypothetical protein
MTVPCLVVERKYERTNAQVAVGSNQSDGDSDAGLPLCNDALMNSFFSG